MTKNTIVARYKWVEAYDIKELIDIYLEQKGINPNISTIKKAEDLDMLKPQADSISFDVRKKDYCGNNYQEFLQEAEKYFKWKYLCKNLTSEEDSKGVIKEKDLDSLIQQIVDPDNVEIYMYEDWKIEINDRVNKEDWELIPQK